MFWRLSNIPEWQSSTLDDEISIIAYVQFLNVEHVYEIQLQPILYPKVSKSEETNKQTNRQTNSLVNSIQAI